MSRELFGFDLGIGRGMAALATASGLAIVLAEAPAATAQPTAGSSSAYGESVNLTLLPVLGSGIVISSGPTASAGGSAGPPYDVGPNQVAGVSVSTAQTGEVLSTGILRAEAASSVPGSVATSSSAAVDDLEIAIVAFPKLLGLTATTIGSQAAIGGTCGALTASGSATIENAVGSGLIGSGLSIPLNPPPNTVLVNLMGITVTLNRQTIGGNGTTSRSISVDAIHVGVQNVVLTLLGVVSGNIVIAHSQAQVTCAPATPTPPPVGPTGTPSPTPTPAATATPTPAPGPTPTPPPGGPTPTPGGPTPTASPGGGPTATPTPRPGLPTTTPTASGPTPTPGGGGEPEDPYLNVPGVGEGEGTCGAERSANASLNPGGIGQLLLGPFYDVRELVEPTGATGSQDVNLQIVNTSPPGEANGGVLARVRFRESKLGREVLAFEIALGCGEAWTGVVKRQASGVPALVARSPIVTAVGATVVTAPEYDPEAGGEPAELGVPAGTTAGDVLRGFLEVIAEERLPCAPLEVGGPSLAGNTYARLGGAAATPPNSLAGEVILIRPGAGVSYSYALVVLSRFVVAGAGSIRASQVSNPGIAGCRGAINGGTGGFYSGLADCANQIDFALSKSRLAVEYDVNPAILGRTLLVVTLPTRRERCQDGTAASPPFACAAGGEQIGCTVYDRLGNRATEDELGLGHCTGATTLLPRVVNVIALGDPSPRADLALPGFESGWIDVNLVTDPALPGAQTHARTGLDPDKVDLLSLGYAGFRGLPAITLVLQEYFNGGVGGVFGNGVEPASRMDIIPPGS